MSKKQLGDHLTTREIELLDRLVEGLSSKELADAMSCTASTVKFHLAHVQAKLGGKNRWHLAAMWATKRAVGNRAVELLAKELLNADLRPDPAKAAA